MLKKSIISILLFTSLLLTGCGGGSPIPSKAGSKPTVFIKSNTAEKFKNITEETAIWNGISPYFVKDNQYLRCDMTEEAMAAFTREGFKVVASAKEADYTVDVTLVSCGSRNYKVNKSELPLKERALYKDFMKWVSETEPSKLPKDAKEIARLISENNPEGFSRFYNDKYIQKHGRSFDYSEYWNMYNMQAEEYIKSVKGIVLPNKYSKIPEEDKKTLTQIAKSFENNQYTQANQHTNGLNMLGQGAGMMGAVGTFGNTARGTAGGIAMGIGLIMSFTAVAQPIPVNRFKVTNNRNGKSWQKEQIFRIPPQNWKANTKVTMIDRVIDDIAWGGIN